LDNSTSLAIGRPAGPSYSQRSAAPQGNTGPRGTPGVRVGRRRFLAYHPLCFGSFRARDNFRELGQRDYRDNGDNALRAYRPN